MYDARDAENLLKRCKAEGKSNADTIRLLAELCLGWPYVFASNGEMCTPEWRRNRIPYCREKKYADMIRDNCPVLSGKQEKIYTHKPNSNEKIISPESCVGCKWYGCRCFDCQGFPKWLMAQIGLTLAGGGATTQWETASNWVAKGEIKDMPPELICCLFKRKEGKMSHEGLSIGDGNGGVIHCSTTVKRGNVNTDRPAWTHWGIPKGLYSTEELRKAGINVQDDCNIPTLRRGSQGDEVADLQMLLNSKYGYELEVDGNFGSKTEAAVKDFQRKHGLTADGVVGAKTWKALGVSGNTNPPADNGNNEIPPSEPEQPQTITIPLKDWQEIKAAIAAAYHVIKQYEG